MANPRLKRKGVAGPVGFQAAPEEEQPQQKATTVPPPSSPKDEEREAERLAAEQAARDQAETEERERQEAEQKRRDAERAERERDEREARERAEAKRAEQELREREARERAEEKDRERRVNEVRAEQDQPGSTDKQSDEERDRRALEAEEREQRARESIKDDQLRLDLGQGDTLVIDLKKARQIQGSDNRQRNVQVPPRVATRVRKETSKSPNDTHVLVFFRALSKAIRYPEEFGKLVTAYRKANAVADPLLGIEISSGKRTRKNPIKFQYNPTLEFDQLLIDLAEQLEVSKAVFVSLLLVHYYGMDVELI